MMKRQWVLRHVLGVSAKKSFLKMQFGGDLHKGKRKTKRVLVSKRYVHLVMHSPMACGKSSMLRKSKKVEAIIKKQASTQNIKICDLVNVGNHLHMLIKIYPRGRACNEAFAKFSRATAGLIAREMLGAERGTARLSEPQAFWPSRPYTRVLTNTHSDFVNVRSYFKLNLFEPIGFDRNETYAPLARGPT